MNLALLIDSLAGGGAEGVVVRLARGLKQRGHGVTLYCLKRAGDQAPALAELGVNVREANSRGADPGLLLRLDRWMAEDRIDVVHAHSCAALCAAFLGAKRRRLPIVHVRHGWTMAPPSRYARLAEGLSPWVTRLVVNCESGRARLSNRSAARRALHIPNGVDDRLPAPKGSGRFLSELLGRTPRGPVVLSVANVRPEKDILTLLRAFAMLRGSDAELVCAGRMGDDEYARQVRQWVQRHGLEARVTWLGHVPDARRLMSVADVVCLSSQTEGTPNVVLEAMAEGAPLVATAVGDVGSLEEGASHYLLRHGETALLTRPRDPARLAAAMDEALSDPRAARERSARARADFLARFTTERMVDAYEAMYRELLPRPKRPIVLHVGPAAPQIGGMVSSIDLLMSTPGPWEFEFRRFATVPPSSTAGAANSMISARAARHLWALARLAGEILWRRVAIVHIHTCSGLSFYRSAVDALLARCLRRPVVLHIRGGRFVAVCAAAGTLEKRFIRWIVRRSAAVVALSEPVASGLRRELGEGPYVVAPNAAPVIDDDSLGAPRASAGAARRFLYFGPLRAEKGLGDLLEAARRLRDEGAAFELSVVGPGEKRAWQAAVEYAGLKPCVTLADAVAPAERQAVFATADCLVHPSHSEGMPNTVLEAAATGLPVIATAVGAVPELLAPDGTAPLGHLTPPHDPRALAEAMRRFIDEPDPRLAGLRLREHVRRHYGVDRLFERLARVYRGALRGCAAKGIAK